MEFGNRVFLACILILYVMLGYLWIEAEDEKEYRMKRYEAEDKYLKETYEKFKKLLEEIKENEIH